jgi:uncharacterized protein (UPF0333 family)
MLKLQFKNKGDINMDYLFVIGGTALAGISLFALYEAYHSKNSSKPTSVTDLISDMADEQLVVDHLDAQDLTSWFKTKNAKGEYKNVLIYPTEANMSNFNLPAGIDLGTDKTIVQALLNKNDDIVLCRAVLFTSINAKLEQLFNKNDGVLIIEE